MEPLSNKLIEVVLAKWRKSWMYYPFKVRCGNILSNCVVWMWHLRFINLDMSSYENLLWWRVVTLVTFGIFIPPNEHTIYYFGLHLNSLLFWNVNKDLSTEGVQVGKHVQEFGPWVIWSGICWVDNMLFKWLLTITLYVDDFDVKNTL
jgi:hypothetical protein